MSLFTTASLLCTNCGVERNETKTRRRREREEEGEKERERKREALSLVRESRRVRVESGVVAHGVAMKVGSGMFEPDLRQFSFIHIDCEIRRHAVDKRTSAVCEERV